MAQIRTIHETQFSDGLKGTLGIDSAGRLYWNGEQVITKQEVRLSWWVNASVILGGLATAVSAVFAALTYLCP